MRILAIGAVACLSGAVLAQECTAWSPEPTSPAPPFSTSQPELVAASSDSARSQTLFVRASPDLSSMETWIWTGSVWVHAVSRIPAPRNYFQMFDTGSSVILTGGFNGNSNRHYDDVWTWDGTSWSYSMGTTAYNETATASVAYDTRRGRLVKPVVYGVLEWAPGMISWELHPYANPDINALNVRYACWDPVTESTLILEIVALNAPMRTWRWDGTSTLPAATAGPSYRASPSILVDRSTQRAILHGGGPNANNYTLHDTWEWSGDQWVLRSSEDLVPRPSPMAFDSARNQIFLLSGTGVRWNWGLSVPAPMFLEQPQSRTVRAGTPVVFSAVVQGGSIRRHTWRRNGVAIALGSPGYAGLGTPQLTIADPRSTSEGVYDLVVDLPCGPITSDGATLDVEYCTADFNHDARVTPSDVFGFMSSWQAGGTAADINASGGTPDDADVSLFFVHYTVGC